MTKDLKKSFYEKLDIQGHSNLFEHIGDYYFFVKNNKGQFISCSKNLVYLLGFKTEGEIVGRDEFDFFKFDIAMQIKNDDEQVLLKGKSIINRVEFIKNQTNLRRWVCTCKVPLFDKAGNIAGLEGYIHPIRHNKNSACMILKKALDEIHLNSKNKFELEKLAGLVNMSTSTFERSFKKYFHVSPFQYIQKVRIEAACSMLQNLECDLSRVALDTGFCDQSHFTKVFRSHMGLTPTQYKARYKLWM